MLPEDFLKEKKETNTEDEKYFDTAEKILGLSDRLAEDIILENVEQQLSEGLDVLNPKINYVSLFREKYSGISPDDDEYDEEYLKESMQRLGDVIGEGIKNRYGVELGDDPDFTTPDEYLKDMETLYEFLFIRQSDNLIDYINHRLTRDRANFIESYSALMDDDKHGKDLFVVQSKKKFKNPNDVVIMHFLNEIIYDIKGQTISAYELFKEIADFDKFEEYNDRMMELLINYGTKIVLKDDREAAEKYLEPLNDPISFGEIRNTILIKYLEECEIDD